MMDFSKFSNKYILTGKLVVINALHIGSGIEDGTFDSPFVEMNGDYYIPGSSFRGYLSSKLESYLNLNLKNSQNENLNLADLKMIFGYTNLNKEDKNIQNRIYEKFDGISKNELRSMAGRIHIMDMPITDVKEKTVTRDGIKIDNNTGTTESGAKFDYDVLTRDTSFDFRLELNNIEDYQLELVFLALRDMILEYDLFGGKLSRGIGKCTLENLKLEFADQSNLSDYIFHGKMKEKNIDEILKFSNLKF